MFKKICCFFLLLPLSFFLRGQCMTVPETLDNLIGLSPLVIEGKVRSQQSFWDTDNKNIYTVNEVEIFKFFQGLPIIRTVHVVTRGGVVAKEGTNDLAMDRVSNALELEVGEMGMFMLQAFPGKLPVTEEVLYRPTEGVLGFIRYDMVLGVAQGVFDSYSNISTELYGLVNTITGLSSLNVLPWDTEDRAPAGKSSVGRAIISVQDGSSHANFEVHAGVGDRLTISGADFGDEPGSVLFPDANSGGRGYISTLAHQVKEWSNERIVLEVPYRAGTGKVRIDKANGESLIGNEDLLVGYDHINVEYTDNTGRKAYETQLTSDNGKGGYDFQFEADFAENVGASRAFRSLIETWACTTGVNFQIGEVTDVDEDANDGINIVRFDNGDELGGRTLAYARSRYRGCYQENTIKWFVDEIEVVVNDDYDWYYGDGVPAASQFDFETVMLHEIGHTQQLGHVINANEVMHFAVGPQQQKRSLSHIDAIGGVFVTDKSTSEAVCGRNLMKPYSDCCETMAIVNNVSDQILCPDETIATFEFAVDFADQWQWQVKNGEAWVTLNDDSTFSGTNTPVLTITRPHQKLSEFRCMVGNDCDQSLISATGLLTVVDIDISLTSVSATCEKEGQIYLDRNTSEGTFRVGINGDLSYEALWPVDQNQLTISVPPGSYEIVLENTDTGCSVDLATAVIKEPIALVLSATLVEKTECTDDTSSIRVVFNDHPDYNKVLLSIDGGDTFENFDDSIGSVVFGKLKNGTYNIQGMWADASCPTTLDPVSIEAISLPNTTLKTVPADCDLTKGAFLFRTEPHPDFHRLEVSLDGGNTYPYAFDRSSGENEIKDIAVGTYNVWARWAGVPCGRVVGTYTIAQKMPDNTNCFKRETDDGNAPNSFQGEEDPKAADEEVSGYVSLTLYPNPTHERIYVKSGTYNILRFQLFSASGALVQDDAPRKQNEDTFFMDVAHTQAGVYTLHIITQDHHILRRVVID